MYLPKLEIPTRNIQKYALIAAFKSAQNEMVTWYSYGNSINLNNTFPDPNAYTVTSALSTHSCMSIKPRF